MLRADVVSDRLRPLTTLGEIARGAAILKEHARGVDVVVVAMNDGNAYLIDGGCVLCKGGGRNPTKTD